VKTLLLAALLFEQHTGNLGAPQPCGPGQAEGCYSNYVALADLDGDGDLDIVFASGGGYYVPGTAQPMAVYLNDGAALFSEVHATAFGGFTGRLRQVAIGDIDGDGDLDVVAPDSWAMQPDAVFVNDGQKPPTFANEGAARLGTSSRAAAARLGDVDGDGDLDLVLSDWGTAPPDSPGTAKVYRNDGTGTFTELAGAVPQGTQAIGTGPIDMDLVDVDGDFDLDLVLASRKGESLLFVNGGDGHFEDANARLPDQPGPYVYGPDACDVDGDGDLDLWLDNGAASLREQLLINDGAGTFTDETAARVTMNPAADDNEVQCADVDDDGDLDAVVASLDDNERVLVNDGSGKFAGVTDAFPQVADATLGLDFGDLNGDGRLDAVTAQGETGAFLNRLYLGTAAQAVDSKAPTIRAVEEVPDGLYTGDVPVRFAVSDRATSDVGPRLAEAWLAVGASGEQKIPARFVGGDLYRAVIPGVNLGDTVVYAACAKDLQGNEVCTAPRTFTSVFADDAGVQPDAGSGQPDAGGGDAASDDSALDDCGCRAGGVDRGAIAGGFLLLLVMLGGMRSRKH
jgi:MYXO-CTERM domain-containing protein